MSEQGSTVNIVSDKHEWVTADTLAVSQSRWDQVLDTERTKLDGALPALMAAFPKEAVERADGKITGKGYSSTGYRYQYILNRLNEVLGLGRWRLVVDTAVKQGQTKSGRDKFTALTEGFFELGFWWHTPDSSRFIVMAFAPAVGGHESFTEADARKGAMTNALKKAAAMLGCGHQAYCASIDDDNVPLPDAQEKARAARQERPSRPEADPGRAAPDPAREQLNGIVAKIRPHLENKEVYSALTTSPALIPSREKGLAAAGPQIMSEFVGLLWLVEQFKRLNGRPVGMADVPAIFKAAEDKGAT